MGQYMLYIWLAILAFCLIVELIDAGTLVSVWFSVGAVIPLLMSFWRTNNVWYITAQIVVFGVVSSLCLIFLRKVAIRFFYKNNKEEDTGMDRLVGKTFKIVRVDDGSAYIKINGVEYQAVTEKEDELKLNQEVVIASFDGNKIVVKLG